MTEMKFPCRLAERGLDSISYRDKKGRLPASLKLCGEVQTWGVGGLRKVPRTFASYASVLSTSLTCYNWSQTGFQKRPSPVAERSVVCAEAGDLGAVLRLQPWGRQSRKEGNPPQMWSVYSQD